MRSTAYPASEVPRASHRQSGDASGAVSAGQVGNRHVNLRYVEVEESPSPGKHPPTQEVKLEAGKSVIRTGSDTLQTADGLLMLDVLGP